MGRGKNRSHAPRSTSSSRSASRKVLATPPLALTTTIITVEEQVRGRLGPGPSGQIGGLISPFLGHFRLPT